MITHTYAYAIHSFSLENLAIVLMWNLERKKSLNKYHFPFPAKQAEDVEMCDRSTFLFSVLNYSLLLLDATFSEMSESVV